MLKPTGVVYVAVPNAASPTLNKGFRTGFIHATHISYFCEGNLLRLAASVGLGKVEGEHHNGLWALGSAPPCCGCGNSSEQLLLGTKSSLSPKRQERPRPRPRVVCQKPGQAIGSESQEFCGRAREIHVRLDHAPTPCSRASIENHYAHIHTD
jgi:hypothetical protein